MEKTFIEDLGNNRLRVTLDPERWYIIRDEEGNEIYYPSVTWILEYYPKGIGYHIWLSKQPDYESGQKIMHAAGDRGSKVHAGIEKLLKKEPLSYFDILPGHDPFQPNEWKFILTFLNWWKDYKPIVLSVEETILNDRPLFGGTADLICIIDNETWLIDWKTSAAIYPSYRAQVAAYAVARGDIDRVGIVRLGTRSKKGYEFKEIKNVREEYKNFLAVYRIWKSNNEGAMPKFTEFAETISLEDNDEKKDNGSPDNGGRTGEDKVGDKNPEQVGKGNTEIPRLF